MGHYTGPVGWFVLTALRIHTVALLRNGAFEKQVGFLHFFFPEIQLILRVMSSGSIRNDFQSRLIKLGHPLSSPLSTCAPLPIFTGS